MGLFRSYSVVLVHSTEAQYDLEAAPRKKSDSALSSLRADSEIIAGDRE